MRPNVLDSGFLIALERRTPKAIAIAEELQKARVVAHVPAGVYAQVWRGSPKQQVIARLVKTNTVRVHDMTAGVASRVGVLIGNSGTSDVVDGHVALLATDLNARVLTSDPGDLAKIDSSLTLVTV